MCLSLKSPTPPPLRSKGEGVGEFAGETNNKMRILKQNTLLAMINDMVVDLPTPSNLNYL